MPDPSPFIMETQAEAHRANQETGAPALYTTPDTEGPYDPGSGATTTTPGASHACIATFGGAGVTRKEGTTVELEDRLAVVTGLPVGVEPRVGGRVTTAVEDYVVVGVQRHAIADIAVSHTLRVRDA